MHLHDAGNVHRAEDLVLVAQGSDGIGVPRGGMPDTAEAPLAGGNFRLKHGAGHYVWLEVVT